MEMRDGFSEFWWDLSWISMEDHWDLIVGHLGFHRFNQEIMRNDVI